jgi:hypothetical protein
VYAIDPVFAVEQAYNSWPTAYPLGEATGVAEKILGSFLLPEKMVVLFTRKADSKAVAKDIADSINTLLKQAYGQ